MFRRSWLLIVPASVLLAYSGVTSHAVEDKPPRPVVKVELPTATVVPLPGEAFVLPNVIEVPPRATVHIKGKFHTGKRSGGRMVIAEARVPSDTPRGALLANGVKSVKITEESECEFELDVHFPARIRPGKIEVRIRDGYLATIRYKLAP